MSTIRVMCVDDNTLLGSALERRIASDPRFQWAGWVENIDGLMGRVAKARPDVVLLDIDMPGRDPFLAIGELTRISPSVRVIMFSGHVQRDLIDRAIDAGAWGYISKHDRIEDLLHAIEEVMQGRFGLSQQALLEQRQQS